MKITSICVAALAGLVASAPYSASAEPLRVFTTVPDLAALAREVGGDRVETFSAVAGPEDPHFAEARPSYIKELSRADAYIQVGMELEIGYAENLLRNARNAKVLPGAPGHIVASEVITPLDRPSGPISRAMGDVHGAGSPHFLVDPLSGLAVAELIRQRLSTIRPADASYFTERSASFRAEVGKRLVGETLHVKYDGAKLALLAQQGRLATFLEQQGDAAKLGGWLGLLAAHFPARVVDDHPIWPYFARTFGLDVVAHLEPKPGIQPTTAHLKQVIEKMKAENVRVLLQAAYYDDRHARFVADATSASIAKLAHQVGALPGTASYLEMIDFNVGAVARALGAMRTAEMGPSS
jgi:ABC-type Zn uptake system ZnuABC Zn-binding protein ZnuA